MSEMIDLSETKERVILAAVCTGDIREAEDSVSELRELVKTAGAETADIVIQNRESVHPGTYLGKGKLEELKEKIWECEATGVVCDDELSPAQLKNLEDILEIKVMDRTMVILDIFAARARTREGKLQVELAQLRYRAARLVGLRASLSRLGGGIGTRGPGEKKLEIDRRLIHDRIGQLKRELEDVKRHRDVQRRRREQGDVLTAAIVGYTNAGKSTLLNRLTNADILAEDKLFATLDPTTRALTLPGGERVLLTDTVGFIRKLPHHLIEAFKSTLEEAKYADVIVHVVDCSNPQMDMQMHVVYETLRGLEITGREIITVFNKIDREGADMAARDPAADYRVRLSAATGEGTEELKAVLETILRNRRIYFEKIFPYADAGKLQLIRKHGRILGEEYKEDGIHVTAYVPLGLFEKLYLD